MYCIHQFDHRNRNCKVWGSQVANRWLCCSFGRESLSLGHFGSCSSVVEVYLFLCLCRWVRFGGWFVMLKRNPPPQRAYPPKAPSFFIQFVLSSCIPHIYFMSFAQVESLHIHTSEWVSAEVSNKVSHVRSRFVEVHHHQVRSSVGRLSGKGGVLLISGGSQSSLSKKL